MKDIKDYLHLYLGQPCRWKAFGDDQWKDATIDLKLLDRIYDRQPIEVKPILRPVPSLTNKEKDEVFHTEFNNKLHTTTVYFESFRLLLIRGVDLFGLIPDGLAIKKTSTKILNHDHKSKIKRAGESREDQ